MTKVFNLSEAKDQLSSLVGTWCCLGPEEIVIAKYGLPLAKLVRVPAAQGKGAAQAFGGVRAHLHG